MLKPSGRKTTVSFFGTVAASSELTLVSKRITAPFKTLAFAVSFPPGMNRTVELRPYISLDPTAPTTGRPTGVNMLTQLGQSENIVGDDERKIITLEVVNPSRGAFLKVYANNTDTFSHTVDAQITLEFLDEIEESDNESDHNPGKNKVPQQPK